MKLVKSIAIVAVSAGITMGVFANPAPTAPQNNICQTNLQTCQQKHPQQAARCEKAAARCNTRLAKQERKAQLKTQQPQAQQVQAQTQSITNKQ
jgi:hypothetical protein